MWNRTVLFAVVSCNSVVIVNFKIAKGCWLTVQRSRVSLQNPQDQNEESLVNIYNFWVKWVVRSILRSILMKFILFNIVLEERKEFWQSVQLFSSIVHLKLVKIYTLNALPVVSSLY